MDGDGGEISNHRLNVISLWKNIANCVHLWEKKYVTKLESYFKQIWIKKLSDIGLLMGSKYSETCL